MKKIIIFIVLTILSIGTSQSQTLDSYASGLITTMEKYQGKRANGIVTIDYMVANLATEKLTNPLIVVEGIDLTSITEPESKGYGEVDYTDFKLSIGNSQSPALRDLIWDNGVKQYDIVYLDFKDGADDMRRNALLVQDLIRWVNYQKAEAGSTEPNVVLGQSMGGVVARYALADMEENGLVHDTKLFISHDAPQQGANVPLGFQYAYRHGKNIYTDSPFINKFAGSVGVPIINFIASGNLVGVPTYLSLLDAPAAKQLIINRIDDNYNLDNAAHDNFYAELKSKGIPDSNGNITGYPVLCRNIAISNGSECGATQNGLQAGDFLVDAQFHTDFNLFESFLNNIYDMLGGIGGSNFINSLAKKFVGKLPGNSNYDGVIQVKSVSYDPSSQIYRGDIRYTKKVLWFIPIKIQVAHRLATQPVGILPYDYYGGGFFTINDPKDKIPSFIKIDKFEFKNGFGFIPTASALDIGNQNVTLADTDFLSPYAGGSPPTGLKSSSFINFTTEFDRANPLNTHNQKHITFNRRNGDWLAAELLGGADVEYTDCSAYCGDVGVGIEGNDVLCENSSEVYTFTGNDNVGNWFIHSSIRGSNPDLVSLSPNGNSVTLTPTNIGKGLVILFAVIDGVTAGACENGDYFKDIWVGTPNITLELESNTNYVTAYLVGENGTNIEDQELTSPPVWEVLNDDEGECPANLHVGPEGLVGYANGNCINWRIDVKITVTNDCGTTVIYKTIEAEAIDCEDGMRVSQNPMQAGNSGNKIIIDPCADDDQTGRMNGREDYIVSIHTHYGEQVYYRSQKETQFNISHLPKGFYIARLRTRQGHIVSKKFIIEE